MKFKRKPWQFFVEDTTTEQTDESNAQTAENTTEAAATADKTETAGTESDTAQEVADTEAPAETENVVSVDLLKELIPLLKTEKEQPASVKETKETEEVKKTEEAIKDEAPANESATVKALTELVCKQAIQAAGVPKELLPVLPKEPGALLEYLQSDSYKSLSTALAKATTAAPKQQPSGETKQHSTKAGKGKRTFSNLDANDMAAFDNVMFGV